MHTEGMQLVSGDQHEIVAWQVSSLEWMWKDVCRDRVNVIPVTARRWIDLQIPVLAVEYSSCRTLRAYS